MLRNPCVILYEQILILKHGFIAASRYMLIPGTWYKEMILIVWPPSWLTRSEWLPHWRTPSSWRNVHSILPFPLFFLDTLFGILLRGILTRTEIFVAAVGSRDNANNVFHPFLCEVHVQGILLRVMHGIR
jgi:hypothetical protein